jgi:hypothetical protein
MIASQSNDGMTTFRCSRWHGDGRIKPLACVNAAQ